MPERQRSSACDTTEIAERHLPSGGMRTRLGRLYFRGEPTFIIQLDTYGLRTDRGYNGRKLEWWKAHIDRFAALQRGGVRFRIRIDPWAFCFDRQALSPWIATENGCEIDRFDETFWNVIRGVAEHAAAQGVLVEFVLFNAAALRLGRGGAGWAHNPFNSAQGGPLTRNPSAAFFHLAVWDKTSLAAGTAIDSASPETRLRVSQELFVREAIRRLDGLDNVTWEIVSQLEGVDPVRLGFISHYIEVLRAADTLDRLATSSTRALRRTDQELYRQVGIDTVQFCAPSGVEPHEEMIETVASLRSYGKPVIVGESELNPDYETMARCSLWQTFIAGGHPCIGGMSSRDPALAAFCAFVADTGAAALTYAPSLATPVTAGLHCNAGQTTDGIVVLYATTEPPSTGATASLCLSDGTWTANSILPATGETIASNTIVAGSGTTRLQLPAFEEDLAVRLVRSSNGVR